MDRMHNKLTNPIISANQSFFLFPTPLAGAGDGPASYRDVGIGTVDNDSITSRIVIKS